MTKPVCSNTQKLNTRDIIYIAVCTALIAVCSWIAIPTAVPFTMQTFGVFFTVGLLGGKKGTISVLVYILLGAVGTPVFSGFIGGIPILVGPLGGYIAGFLLAALTMWLFEKVLGRSKYIAAVSMAVGMLICYVAGTVWFVMLSGTQDSHISIWAALTICVIPYLIPDIIKIVLAYILSNRIRRLMSA